MHGDAALARYNPARSNCIVPAFYYRAPVDDSDQWDEISLRMTEELIEYTTSQEVAALMLEPIAVPGGMIVPSERWLKGIRDIADRWGALLIFDGVGSLPPVSAHSGGLSLIMLYRTS